MREEFIALVSEPTAESYRRAWEKVTSSAGYDPYGTDIDDATNLFEAGKHAEARQRANEVMAKWLLNPRIHLVAAAAARAMGDSETAEVEGMFAVQCLRGILSTGDGTRERPYLVCSVHDEYDVLAHLKKQMKRQSLVEDGERVLDGIECEDGTEVWFDVTRPYSQAGRGHE